MRRSRLFLASLMLVTASMSTSLTSCGGGSSGEGDLVLLGFNLPNIAGVPLNQPLIFTFSSPIDADSITLDTLRVVGPVGPFFEQTIVDGNLIALLPRSPTFEDYSDAGLAVASEYTVSLAVYPAVDTIESVTGRPLIQADSYFFRTLPTPTFIEPRRAVLHGLAPSAGGISDDEGCLQNSSNALYVAPNIDPSVVQEGTGPGAALLCLRNQGAPRAIEPESFPRHDQRSIGTPSATRPGYIDLPAIRVQMNEPLDPITVAPYKPVEQLGINVQLWRVALRDGTFVGPEPIQTNKPILVQTAENAEIIIVPSGPVPQGTYLVSLTPSITDLPGNPLRFDDRPNPAIGGYTAYESEAAFGATIPTGWRLYFRTLEVPNTSLAIIEQFLDTDDEWGDAASASLEPGVHTDSIADAMDSTFDGRPLNPITAATSPNITKTYVAADPSGTLIGQTTTANWNSDFRFLNLPSLTANPDIDAGVGVLRAVWKPYAGDGSDGSTPASWTSGTTVTFNTDNGSADGDGIWEYESFNLPAGATINVQGSKPLLILCRGDLTIAGHINLAGGAGGAGLDTDGSALYTGAGAVPVGGAGGLGVAGGGAGGAGANPIAQQASGANGAFGNNLFGTWATENIGNNPGLGATGFADGAGANDGSGGGGGGGFGAAGSDGLRSTGGVAHSGGANAGSPIGSATFDRALTLFTPDRGYSPFSNIAGGTGGGGGSSDDDGAGTEVGDGTAGNNDDAGAGGGAGGGALCVIAEGTVTVAATGSINADGGAGGSTFAFAQQIVADGADGMAGTADDVVVGVTGPTTGGSGGPGGGGSGGAILLIGKGGVDVVSGAVLSAVGGVGGTSGNANRDGGAGGEGRISLVGFAGGTNPTNGGTVTPAPFMSTSAATAYNPTIELASCGQSQWIDQFTPTAVYAPDPDGPGPEGPQLPLATTNFAFLTGGGLVQGPGGSFDGVWEFQGADSLTPGPVNVANGGPAPTVADGLTSWVAAADIGTLSGKRFLRWRWRFFVSDTYAGWKPGTDPMPSVSEIEIPFEK